MVDVLVQRLSVVILDLVLVSAALYAFRKLPCGQSIVHFLLVVSNAGLLVVDHIHFQYNGVLLGKLLRTYFSGECLANLNNQQFSFCTAESSTISEYSGSGIAFGCCDSVSMLLRFSLDVQGC